MPDDHCGKPKKITHSAFQTNSNNSNGSIRRG